MPGTSAAVAATELPASVGRSVGRPPSVPVPDMTYNVFGGTLNLAQSNQPAECDE